MNDPAQPKIDNIPHDAPLFNNTPLSQLFAVTSALSSASFGYADDTGKEWTAANEQIEIAAKIINQHKLGYTAIRALHDHKPQLVSLDQLIDKVLTQARNQTHAP